MEALSQERYYSNRKINKPEFYSCSRQMRTISIDHFSERELKLK